MMDDPVSTPVHPLSASPDKIVVHTTVPSQALSELTRVAHATPPSDPPTRSTLSAQVSAEKKRNGAVPACRDVAVE